MTTLIATKTTYAIEFHFETTSGSYYFEDSVQGFDSEIELVDAMEELLANPCVEIDSIHRYEGDVPHFTDIEGTFTTKTKGRYLRYVDSVQF